ncbi:MAG: diheme cytochrome c-553 [Ginsengibacter sp.]
MKKQILFFLSALVSIFLLGACNQNESADNSATTDSSTTSASTESSASVVAGDSSSQYGGFKSQVAWGGHLVQIVGCDDCHTPKKITAMGPAPDTALFLSGHPSKMPAPDVDRKEMESKGIAATNDLTAWVGPWGISYAANLTPDNTGLGNWTFEQFDRAFRHGMFMGSEHGRQLLPPMPWQGFSHMTDAETRAIFAYLKTIKPIHNVVPAAQPPVSAPHQ